VPKIRYPGAQKQFNQSGTAQKYGIAKQALVPEIDRIMTTYALRGFHRGSRGVSYQLLQEGFIPSNLEVFDMIEDMVKKGREMGLFDWDHLEIDASRQLHQLPHWPGVSERLRSAAQNHRLDLWASQPVRSEVVVEKDGQAGTVAPLCQAYNVPYMSSHGTASITLAWRLARRALERTHHGRLLMRLHDHTGDGEYDLDLIRVALELRRPERGTLAWYVQRWAKEDKQLYPRRRDQLTVVLYGGDHDPTGFQMEEVHLRDTLTNYGADPSIVTIKRVLLTWDQAHGLQPDGTMGPAPLAFPAKIADPNHAWYVQRFGTMDAWEMDALEPEVIVAFFEAAIQATITAGPWNRADRTQKRQREHMCAVADQWESVLAHLGRRP